MNRVITFISAVERVTRNHRFLITWTIATLTWLLTSSNAPIWVIGNATYDLIVESTLAISLWLDVIKKKVL